MRRIVWFMLIGPLVGYIAFIAYSMLGPASGSSLSILSIVLAWLFVAPFAYVFGLPGAAIIAMLDYALERLGLDVLIRLPICAVAAYVASYACFLFLKGFLLKPDPVFGFFGVAAAIIACAMTGRRELGASIGNNK